MAEHLVIVGGGQAAAQAVQSLRQQSFAGAITLLCDEPYPPYQRPPLSKKYFAGELTRERLLLRPAAFYAEKGVTLEQNARVEELDAVGAARAPARRPHARLRPLAARHGQPRAHARRARRDAARRALPAHDRRRRRHHGVARAGRARAARRRGLHRPRGRGRRAAARLRRHRARGRRARHVARRQRRSLRVLRSRAPRGGRRDSLRRRGQGAARHDRA